MTDHDPVAVAEQTARSEGVDLTDCDREPIHIPGSVQPHGALIAMTEPALVAKVASENTADVLGVAVDEVLGASIDQVLGVDAADAVFDAVRLDDVSDANPLLADGPGGRRLEVTLHRVDGLLVAEIEPAREGGGVGQLYRQLRGGLDRLQSAQSQQTVCDTLADVVADLTGLDRVMVYRFAEDDHGEVVSEVVRPDWPPYLGLHYPASDIPAQARVLYVRNRLRIIAERDYTPSPLRPADNPVTGRPLDLSHAVLRSVSPIHLEYLRNMGVEASMSLSLVRGERLWGLVACHHGAPIHLPFDLRAACELLAQAATAQLGSVMQLETTQRRERASAHIDDLLRQAVAADEPVPALVTGAVTLRDVVECAGAAVAIGDRCLTVGRTPDEDAVRALVAALPESGPGDVIARTSLDDLGGDIDTGGLVGLLCVAMSHRSGAWLLWFREEVVHEVGWGGDPSKAMVQDGEQLLPRTSFALWREQVHGQSRPWTPTDRRVVEQLWRGLSDVLVADTDRLERSNADLTRRNDELDAFAYTASHDLKAPLHGIAAEAELLRADHADLLGDAGVARLDAIGHRTRQLTDQIETLLAYGRVGHATMDVGRVSLSALVDDVIDAQRFQIADRAASVSRTGALPDIVGDASLLRQLFGNLLANALTYCDADAPVIEIGLPTGAERAALPGAPDDVVVVAVRDNGAGVPADERAAVFEVFRRGTGAERFGAGTGVGLATARRIAERHDGSVHVVDGALGGATFCVTLGGGGDG